MYLPRHGRCSCALEDGIANPKGRSVTRRVSAAGLAAVLAGLFLVLTPGIPIAQPRVQMAGYSEGFGGLNWGESVRRATTVYSDLAFERYAILSDREEPAKVFHRRHETASIDNVSFDAVEYWFQNDRFVMVRAVMRSEIGPRTLMTRAEGTFDRLFAAFEGRYGEPRRQDVRYVGALLSVLKTAEWRDDRFSIGLRYEGPKESNADLLVCEIRGEER